MTHHHPLPFSAELTDGGVRFRLWAPQATAVTLRLEGMTSRDLPMERGPGGWFSTITRHAQPGTRYRYQVQDLLVPDPASRYQPEDVHGPSEVIDPTAYQWEATAWRGRVWEEIVIYELHTGTFSIDGDFGGVMAHLDHLVALGVTAVELMPIADFPGRRNWGYDGVLLFAPDSRYGGPDDLKRLVEACHARDLCVFLDVVYNHFGPDGNYLGAYAGSFFTERHTTPWGAAINFDGPDSRPVRDFYIHNALYWLEEFQFDGLRFDAVHAIIDESTPDILTELAQCIDDQFGDIRHIHLILENDKNQARYLARQGVHPLLYTAQWNDDLHHALRVVTTHQHGGYYADYADRPAERLGRALAEGFAYQGDPSPYREGATRGEPSTHLPPTAFISFIQNHDQVGNDAFGTRLPSLATAPAIRAAVATYLLAPQIPMLFQGEEWGADQPFAFFCDFRPELAEAVRKGRRDEFVKFPEFAAPEARDRIPDPNAPDTFERSRLDWSVVLKPSHMEWLTFYRKLLALRAGTIVPRLTGEGSTGQYRVLAVRALEVVWTLPDHSRLLLLANYDDHELQVSQPQPALLSEALFATHQLRRITSQSYTLPSHFVGLYLTTGTTS
jgi:maltooligosyltrehalose trehalohydrolase